MSEDEEKEVDDEEVEEEDEEDDDEDVPGLPACDEEYDQEKFYYWDKDGIPTEEDGKWVRMERVFMLGGRDVRRETYFRT
ncbi:MAG: hypothetical protein KGH99_07285 [Thaumarchaeota archaeon]|nr:hypothetical protein [Nitrososphaerota archaeon]MDE1873263.1 hypothetical protein [Nitrososphaerota archaeon]